MSYLMPKPSLWESSSTIQPKAEEIKDSYHSQGYQSKSECNSVTGVWTCCDIEV